MPGVAKGAEHGTPGGARASRHPTAWSVFLGIGAAVTVGYYVLPTLGMPGVAQSITYLLASTVAALAVLAGVLIHRPPGALPWLVLAAAQAMHSVGDIVYFVLHTVLH